MERGAGVARRATFEAGAKSRQPNGVANAATRAPCFPLLRSRDSCCRARVMPASDAGGDEEEEWHDDPSGFDELLSQCLDEFEKNQAPEELSQASQATQNSTDEVGSQQRPVPDSDSQHAPPTPEAATPQATQCTTDEEGREQRPVSDSDLQLASPTSEADLISLTGCVIDPRLDQLDPQPNVEHLLRLFDQRFFNSSLQEGGVTVHWSRHMTLSAGLCQYFPKQKRCVIKLSIPLVKEAPRKDFVQTLLHEMIHAHLFLSGQDDSHEEHGPLFTHHMARINTLGHCYVTLKHTFPIKWHIWKCDGSCSKKPPYFGIVKRSSSRAPGPEDKWFSQHEKTCGGSFSKTGGPDVKVEASSKRGSNPRKPRSEKQAPTPASQDIRQFFKIVKKSASTQESGGKDTPRTEKPPSVDKKTEKDGRKDAAVDTPVPVCKETHKVEVIVLD